MTPDQRADHLDAANVLEAAMTLLPSRLYSPARQAVKALRHQAAEGTDLIPPELCQDMAKTLRDGMPTVSNHLAGSLQRAADLLYPL